MKNKNGLMIDVRISHFQSAGIYAGDGKVIHFLTPMETGDPKTSQIVESDLSDFLGPGTDVTWRVYRYAVGAKELGTTQQTPHTSWQSDDVSTVLARARAALEEGFGQYNIVGNNCEDFALYCKTGQRCLASGQYVSTLNKIAAARQAAASGYRSPLVYAGCVLGWFTEKDFKETSSTKFASSWEAAFQDAPQPSEHTGAGPSTTGPQVEAHAVKGSSLPGSKMGPLETSL